MSSNWYWDIPKDIVFNCLSILEKVTPKSSTIVNAPPPPPKPDMSLIVNQFNSSPWIKVAAISGAASVVLGAYGAHALKNQEKRPIFDTANKYHFYHSLALMATPFLKRPNLTGYLFLGGILIFCGTCYCNAITNNNTVVRFTPIGGMMFIFGWLSMLF